MNKLEIPIAVLELEILALLSAHKRVETIPGMSIEQIINFLKPERDLGRESCRRAVLALQQRNWVEVTAGIWSYTAFWDYRAGRICDHSIFSIFKKNYERGLVTI